MKNSWQALEVDLTNSNIIISIFIASRGRTHHVTHAIASEGLAQGPYVADRVGLEPATVRTEGIEPYH